MRYSEISEYVPLGEGVRRLMDHDGSTEPEVRAFVEGAARDGRLRLRDRHGQVLPPSGVDWSQPFDLARSEATLIRPGVSWGSKPHQSIASTRGPGHVELHRADLMALIAKLEAPAATPRPAERAPEARPDPSEVEAWFVEYVQSEKRAGNRPNRDENMRAAKERFGVPISRNMIQHLREKHAEDWCQKGRPRKAR